MMIVEDAFYLEGKGFVVVGNVPERWITENTLPFSDVDKAVISDLNGFEKDAVIDGIDIFTAPLSQPDATAERFRTIGVLLAGISTIDEVPIGGKLLIKSSNIMELPDE